MESEQESFEGTGSEEQSEQLRDMNPEEESKAQSQDETHGDGFEAKFELGDHEDVDEGHVVDAIFDNHSVLSSLKGVFDITGSDDG